MAHPSLFTLNVDIAGPFKLRGVNPAAGGDHKKAKNMKDLKVFVLAKFTFPSSQFTGECKKKAYDGESVELDALPDPKKLEPQSPKPQ